mgnify:FL=1
MANIIATPPVMNDVGQSGGRMRVVSDSFTDVSMINDGDVARLCRLPANARIWSLKVYFADWGGSGAVVAIGLYPTSGTLEHADDEKAYKTALDVSSAVAIADYRFATDTTMATAGRRLFEMTSNQWAGAITRTEDETSDGMYDVCITAEHTDVISGLVSFVIEYTVD